MIRVALDTHVLVDEYIDVLGRPELGISRKVVDQIIKQLLLVCEWVTPKKRHDPNAGLARKQAARYTSVFGIR